MRHPDQVAINLGHQREGFARFRNDPVPQARGHAFLDRAFVEGVVALPESPPAGLILWR